jgi:type IV secretory pathway TraG/TraD family ATPase VirD4
MECSEGLIQHLRALRLATPNIKLGKSKTPSDTKECLGIAIGFIATIVVFFAALVFGKGLFHSIKFAFYGGMIAAAVYWLLPILYFFKWVFARMFNPKATFLNKLTNSQKRFTCFAFALGLTVLLDINTPKIFKWLQKAYPHFIHFHLKTYASIFGKNPTGGLSQSQFIVALVVMLVLVFWFFSSVLRKIKDRQAQKIAASVTEQETAPAALPFSLWLGTSTGKLSSLNHGAGIQSNQEIAISIDDAAQNILILGGIGSGKTTRAVHPMLMQLLDQDCGGLIFDIKGDFQKAVRRFAEITNRNVITISPHHGKMNLLAGLTPEVAASFLKSIFTLNTNSKGDSFWIDTATELCRNTLGILSFLPQQYSLHGLYCYLFDLESRVAVDEQVSQLLPDLTAPKQRLLNSYNKYHESIYDKFDEKVKSGVNATIAQVLAPFYHPELIDAFCSEDEDNLRMEEVLNGAIYLVEMPLSVWGLGGKVVYTIIKLRFFNVMQQRVSHAEWNQERPVFFMCDEFQEIVSANRDGISDLNFWDKSRSSKTIGIISAQAISSFYAAIGDHDIANTLLQNFRQKLCFKTEDATTLSYFNRLADKVEIYRTTTSHTTSKSSDAKSFFGGSKSTSNTSSTSVVDKAVIDAQLFRNLDPEQALALLSINGRSMDDIARTIAVYV